MIIHPKVEHKGPPEVNYWLVYRYNDDLKRVECWNPWLEHWNYSVFYKSYTKDQFNLSSLQTYTVSYQSSWAEPYED